MKLIFGLGNPGEKYEFTRHNAGFLALEELRRELTFPEFKFEKKWSAEISEGKYEGDKIVLVKPQTFMNKSGETVRKVMDFYKLSPEDITILHDDLDIALGKIKLVTDSSSAGHNGVQNIIDLLGTQQFKRFRIGIGEKTVELPQCRIGAHDFVLGKFTEEEIEQLKKSFSEISKDIKQSK